MKLTKIFGLTLLAAGSFGVLPAQADGDAAAGKKVFNKCTPCHDATAGKDKDPNFDLKKNLIGNLGDDFIQLEKAPKSAKPEDLQQAPTLTLIGSPNPAQLLDALRMITSLMPPPISSAPLKEREYLGKKIYSMSVGDGMELGAEEPAEAGKPPRKDADKLRSPALSLDKPPPTIKGRKVAVLLGDGVDTGEVEAMLEALSAADLVPETIGSRAGTVAPAVVTATVADIWGVSGVGNLFKPGTLTGKVPQYQNLTANTNAYKSDRNNVAPSLGLTWRPTSERGLFRSLLGNDGDTVLRAA